MLVLKHHIRFMHLELSPAGCFSRLCTLCFTVFFSQQCFSSDVNVRWTSLYAHASSMHKALCLPVFFE